MLEIITFNKADCQTFRLDVVFNDETTASFPGLHAVQFSAAENRTLLGWNEAAPLDPEEADEQRPWMFLPMDHVKWATLEYEYEEDNISEGGPGLGEQVREEDNNA